MRYINIESYTFVNADGVSKVLKKIRPPVKTEDTFLIQDTSENLDVLAIQAYGTDAEPLWYHIADQNWETIVENYFDLSQIRKFEVPLI